MDIMMPSNHLYSGLPVSASITKMMTDKEYGAADSANTPTAEMYTSPVGSVCCWPRNMRLRCRNSLVAIIPVTSRFRAADKQ